MNRQSGNEKAREDLVGAKPGNNQRLHTARHEEYSAGKYQAADQNRVDPVIEAGARFVFFTLLAGGSSQSAIGSLRDRRSR